ncbi:hypothetical protein RS9917_08285 [Synechococcus sp. RS9917]|nr:hypothetical protein RS9917_08285 [Synechococcus sp. RS9917]
MARSPYRGVRVEEESEGDVKAESEAVDERITQTQQHHHATNSQTFHKQTGKLFTMNSIDRVEMH